MQETRRQISVSTSFNYEIPLKEQLPLIANAGFTHISIGGQKQHAGYLTNDGRKTIRNLLSRYSLSIDTIHGPRIDQVDSIEQLNETATAAMELSVGIIVVHCSTFTFGSNELPKRLEALLPVCDAMCKVAEKKRVRFALENVLPGSATDLVGMLMKRLDPNYFGYCYDSSHDQVGGPKPFRLLDEWSNRLIAVHLSDRIKDFVDHVIPGEGFILWTDLADSLRRSSIMPPLLLEVMMTHSAEKDPHVFLCRAYNEGCKIYDLVFGGAPT